MKNDLVSGSITSIYGDDINTDDIIPAWTMQESREKNFFKKYAFQYFDKDFVTRCAKEKNNFVVGGKNFACGSSREHAVWAFQENSVKGIIATSFPDIFYRNSLNNGLILLIVDDTSFFKINKEIAFDFNESVILYDNQKIKVNNSQEDLEIFQKGGKIGLIREDLEQILSDKTSRIDYTKSKLTSNKPQTIVEKIISDHLGRNVYAFDHIDKLPIDLLYFNEVIAPFSIGPFKQYFKESFKKFDKPIKVFDNQRIFFVPDHSVPSCSISTAEGIDMMEEFAKEQNCYCFKEGDGIEHVVLAEEGKVLPGQIIFGTDSHTDTNGAFNTLAFGIGTTDASYALATGYLYDFVVPKTLRIDLHGQLSKGVYGKDVILHIIGKLGMDGALKREKGRILEFGGPGLKTISIEGRATMSNMAVEMSARSGIFEFDEIVEKYLKGRTKQSYKTYRPDEGCIYEKVVNINLSEIEPSVAFPNKPENVTPISKIHEYMLATHISNTDDLAKITDLKITDAFIGSCTNGRYEDFVEAAKILKGKKVHKDVNLIVIPASRKVYQQLARDNILSVFIEAGANIESANCGPCFGKHMGLLSDNGVAISTANRNFIGRMGSQKAKIFLASPVTVAASALTGEITDPREFL
jgi:3-isopropylmalate/(R)-2-methylmalate dehydratase large subunit